MPRFIFYEIIENKRKIDKIYAVKDSIMVYAKFRGRERKSGKENRCNERKRRRWENDSSSESRCAPCAKKGIE